MEEVNAMVVVLTVELESQGETRVPGDSTLRDEIQELLRGADSETLRKAIKALREAKRGWRTQHIKDDQGRSRLTSARRSSGLTGFSR